MSSRQSRISKFFALFATVVLLSILSAPTAQPILAQDDISSLEKENNAPLTAGNPYTFTAPPEDIQGHLGYDKATGQSLPDPTTIRNPESTAADLLLMKQQSEAKLARIDSTQIRFRSGYEIHPQPGIAPEVVNRLSQIGGETIQEGYYVIQFDFPIPTQARRDLEVAGVTFYDDLDVGAALAKIPPQVLAELQRMSLEGTVRYVGAIPLEARVSPSLVDLAITEPESISDIVLLTFDQPTQAQLDELSQYFTIEQRSDGPMHILKGKVVHNRLLSVVSLSYVRWIEPATLYELGNLEGGMAMGADIMRGQGYSGAGINVSVIDTGIARSGSTYHLDLPASRITDQWDYQNNDSNAADDNNHGTHVAGSIGGSYNSSNFYSEAAFQGVAPGVNFYIYKLCCGVGQFSDTWFQQALQRGSTSPRVTHVSNNSWGGGNGLYTVASEIADRAVRGEYNGNKINMVIISHNDDNLTRAPGTAKNAITVGSVKDGNYPNTPFANCGGTDEYDWPPAQRVCYSNFGPLDIDKNSFSRVKPDVMATGAMIRSTVPWYNFGDQRYYDYMHGTSMAAPHVSGAIAQFLDHFPSLLTWPEVVKAFMLATTMNVNLPSELNLYGRGLLDAYHMNWYQPGIQAQSHWWGTTINSTGDSMDFTFEVPAGYEEVIVVLTWPDPAGAIEGINDLDISYVRDGGGVTRGSSVTYDDNVEYVRIPAGFTGGSWTVRVYGFNITSAQTFGLAANPILAPADLSISGSAEYIGSPGSVDPNESFYYHQYVSNSGYAAGGTYARLFVPGGFTVDGVRVYTQDGASHYYSSEEIYHPAGSSYWRAALGATIASFPRHVRWFIRPNSDAACGPYSFGNQAFFTQAGVLTASPANSSTVRVTCFGFVPRIVK